MAGVFSRWIASEVDPIDSDVTDVLDDLFRSAAATVENAWIDLPVKFM